MHPLKVFSFAERQTELQKHAHRHQSQNSGLDRLFFFVNLALLALNVFNKVFQTKKKIHAHLLRQFRL